MSELGNSTTTFPIELDTMSRDPAIFKVYKRRYYMLFLFSFLSLLCGMLFPQYVSNANINLCYYGISENTLNWTAYMFMLSYVIFIFPVSYCMNYIGLRWTLIATALANTIACAVQFAGTNQHGFLYILISTAFASASNLLVLSVPAFLAATWFPRNELSRACAGGVFGNQLGVALGYLFSPLMTSNKCSDEKLIAENKFTIACILTGVNLFWLLLVTFTFQNAPEFPPSPAQVKKESTKSHLSSVICMFKDGNFVLLFIMYGLMVGTYFAITTILNDLCLRYFPHREVEIGWMGTLFIVSGLFGSIIAGYILDYTHRFKETTIGICVASLTFFMVFASLLTMEKIWITFITIALFGFFLTGFLPVGIEYGIEITFPEPEVISASLLNASTNGFGLILTEAISHLLDLIGPLSSNSFIVLILFLSIIITFFLPRQYKRSDIHSEKPLSRTSSLTVQHM